MNNTFSLQQTSKTSNLDANLLSRKYKLNLMADFMRNKYENPKLRQSEVANQLGYTSSTLQRYRNDISMLSPYRIQSNDTNKRTKKASNTNVNNNSYRELENERPQMTSNDLKLTQTNSKSNEKNNDILKAGSIHENIEIDGNYLDEVLDNNDLWMDLAMQIISTDKTVKSDTIEDLKDFNSRSLTTQAKKGEHLVCIMPAIKKPKKLLF